MATGIGLALPEPLHDENVKSWFMRYEVCVAANGWNDQKSYFACPRFLRAKPGPSMIPWEMTRKTHTRI